MSLSTIYSVRAKIKAKGKRNTMANTSAKPSAIGAMSREQLDAELQKGVDSIKAGKVYSAEEVDSLLVKEFGI